MSLKRLHYAFALSFLILLFIPSGCGVIQNLRQEIEEDEPSGPQSASDYDFYKNPANRYVPPPPANVSDARAAALSGTPVDLSGTRAKRVRTTAADFWSENSKNENSLWLEDGQNNYLFARNKLKMPGDIVSVVIEDGLRNEMVGSVKKLLPPEYSDQDIIVPGLTKVKAAADKLSAAAKPADGGDAAAPKVSDAGPEDIMTAEVLERFPNGNVRLRGVKRIPFKHQVRNIEVLAICKGSDIAEDDTVKSSRFFEHKVELYR